MSLPPRHSNSSHLGTIFGSSVWLTSGLVPWRRLSPMNGLSALGRSLSKLRPRQNHDPVKSVRRVMIEGDLRHHSYVGMWCPLRPLLSAQRKARREGRANRKYSQRGCNSRDGTPLHDFVSSQSNIGTREWWLRQFASDIGRLRFARGLASSPHRGRFFDIGCIAVWKPKQEIGLAYLQTSDGLRPC